MFTVHLVFLNNGCILLLQDEKYENGRMIQHNSDTKSQFCFLYDKVSHYHFFLNSLLPKGQ